MKPFAPTHPLPLRERIGQLAVQRLADLGEGLFLVEKAIPLTQLRLASQLASLRNPLPQGERVEAL